ncbi:hypothetical protein VH570_17385 [Sphingobium sp. HT1-2]|uniref:hypothetical protein n=1 Tax=Sphingobium sp. HT1-2 TaxID=3111640 RepID=UPI003C1162CA
MEYLNHLPLILQAACITGLLALLGVILTTSVTRGQLAISRQTLFVSMLPRRIEWNDKFRKAVKEWDGQMQTIINWEDYEPPEPTWLFEINNLVNEAAWLFGDEVANAARRIEKEFEKVKQLRIRARSKSDDSMESAMVIGSTIYDAYALFEPLKDAMRPMLYVGDIRNKKTPKRLRLR